MYSLAVITVSTSIVARLGAASFLSGSQGRRWMMSLPDPDVNILTIDSNKPITLIYKDPKITQDLSYPKGTVRLDFGLSIRHLNLVDVPHPETEAYVRTVFPDYERAWDLDWIKNSEGSGFQHVVGRIDFTLCAMDAGISFVWVYPEASLHPTAQLTLADALISLSQRSPNDSTKPPLPLILRRKPKVPL